MDRGKKVGEQDSATEMFKSHRFIFGNGEEQPPTAFIWEEEEIPLTNSLLELMTVEERGEEGLPV